MPEEMTINQTVQFALEAVSGTTPAGGANKKPGSLSFQLDPDFAHTEYAPMGERFDTVSVPSMEKSKLTLNASPQTYDELDYVLSALLGDATKTTPAGAKNARKKAWSPPVSGVLAGRTLYLQQGSSSRARAVNYGRLTGATWAADRKTCTIAGSGYAQQIQDDAERIRGHDRRSVLPHRADQASSRRGRARSSSNPAARDVPALPDDRGAACLRRAGSRPHSSPRAAQMPRRTRRSSGSSC